MNNNGWICPKCQVVYAPIVTQCSCSVGKLNYLHPSQVPIHNYPPYSINNEDVTKKLGLLQEIIPVKGDILKG